MASLSPGFWVALGVMAVQLPAVLSGGFGMFRDEFYYIACSDRLAWGFVDHPPLSIFILRLLRLAFGDSLLALRLVPALAVAALAWLERPAGQGDGRLRASPSSWPRWPAAWRRSTWPWAASTP